MAMAGVPNNGVPLDADQQSLSECNFSDCRRSSDEVPMLLVVFKGSVRAVCQRCYRMKMKQVFP